MKMLVKLIDKKCHKPY